jgi:BolA protein
MESTEIKQRILAAYPDAQIETDGADCNFNVTIISDAFTGQSPLQRQRPVLALFKDDIASGALHALSVKARTPTEVSN